MNSPAGLVRAAVAVVNPRSGRPSRRSSKRLLRTRRGGFTLVEILVATALVLLLMGMVVTIFASVSENVRTNRAMLETADRLRATQRRLQLDLQGVTCPMLPPLNPADGYGYFEYVEGPLGPIVDPSTVASNTLLDSNNDSTPDPDRSFGDADDLLLFTTRSRIEPFVGRYTYKGPVNPAAVPPENPVAPYGGNDGADFMWRTGTIQSPVAEVCWFMRGTTLYRRVLLVKTNGFPDFDQRATSPGIQSMPTIIDPTTMPWPFYNYYDLSVRPVGGATDRNPAAATFVPSLVPNSLGDLTKRENRYGHQPFVYPHDVRFWGPLGLPTLRECSHIPASGNADEYWPLPYPDASLLVQSNAYADNFSQLVVPNGVTISGSQWVTINPPVGTYFDPWLNPFPAAEVDPATGTLLNYASGSRISEDVILQNVLAFDVKAYDPGALIIATTGGDVLTPGDAAYFTTLASGAYTIVDRGAYVDLNYLGLADDTNLDGVPDDTDGDGNPDDVDGNGPDFAASVFCGPGLPQTFVSPWRGLRGSEPGSGDLVPSVYCVGSTHYERDGFDQDGDGMIDEGADGYDNGQTGGLPTQQQATGVGSNGVDDFYEQEAPPPYPVPLRGIQIKIRVFEPQSKEIREVTVTQSFQPG
jgi:type II secretory pathway pseudopilin PulG